MTRPFLKIARKKKQRPVGKSRKPSLLAGSIALLAASAFSLTTAPSARGAVVYWDINGTTAGASGNGSAAGTWDGPPTGVNALWNSASDGTGAVNLWSDGDVAVFSAGGNATQAFTIAVSGTVKIGGLTFEEGLVTLSGGTLQMTVNSNFDVASGLTATVNSTVDGAFDLTKTGAGTLVLGGTNTYTGRTLISGGTLSISTDANLGTAPGLTADSISFTGSSTLQFTGTGNPTINSNRGITIGNTFTGTVQVAASANTVAYGGIITGAAGTTFKKTGAGTLDLSGNSTAAFLGALNVDSGTLKLSGNGEMAGTSGVTIGNRATLTLDNTATNLGNRTAGAISSGGGTINFIGNAAATTETLGALTLNAGALTIASTAGAGGSTLTIPTLTRSVPGGTLYLNSSASASTVLTTAPALVNSILKYAVVNNGTLISFANYPTSAGANQTVVPLALASHAQGAETTWNAATVNARPTVTVPSAVGAARTLYTLTLDSGVGITAPTTSDRTITISGGVLQTGGVSLVAQGGGTLDNIFAFGANEAIFYILGSLQLDRGNTNSLTGTAGFTKSGAGTLILNGVSTLTGTGAFNVNEGILELRGGTSLMTTATGVNLNGATLRLFNDTATTYTGNWTVNADSSIIVSRATAAATATTHTVGALSIGGGRVLSVSSANITAGTTYGLTAGALTLTSGGGTIDVANNGAGLGTMIVTSVAGAFPLIKAGAGDLVENSVSAGYTGPVEIQAGRIGWGGSTGTITESQIFSGAGGLIKSGVVVVNLTGANTFTGGVTVNGGTLGFSTVSNNGGSASNLGQGTDGISLGGGVLSLIGSTSQSTNRAISLTASSTLNAGGTAGAIITYTGAITPGTDFSLNLTGTGAGVISGGITQPAGTAVADLNVNSGTWTLSGSPISIADDVIVTGSTAVLNLNSTGVLTGTGASNGLYFRSGAIVNLGASNVTGVANSGGNDFFIIGDTGLGTLNTNTFNVTTLRLDIGDNDTLVDIGNVTGSGTVTITADFNFYRGTISANLAGAAVIQKFGIGDVTLSGDNSGLTTAAAATEIDAGNLILDYTANNATKLSATNSLDMRGGTLTINGSATADTSQTVAGLTLANLGSNVIAVNSAGTQLATLNLGAITRAASNGTIRFTVSGLGAITTTTANTTSGILGGWATITDSSGVTNFAANNGSNTIVAITPTTRNNLSTWVAGEHLTDDTTGFTGTLGATTGINSLRFNAAGPSTVTIPDGLMLGVASGGVLQTASVTGGTSLITGGRLISGTGPELIFTTDSATQMLTVDSAIAGAQAVTKTGSGTLQLGGNNSYSGTTRLFSGTLRLSGGNAIGDTSAMAIGATQNSILELLSNETFGSFSGGANANLVATELRLNANTLTVNQTAGATFSGVITGAAGSSLTKTGAANLQLDASSNPGFLGTVTVNQGLFYLTGSTTLLGATGFTLNKGGAFLIDNNGTTTSGDRIGATATITLNSADGAWSGETRPSGLGIRRDQGSTQSETLGVLSLNSGASYTRLDATVASGIAQIITDNITRSNNATLDVRGTLMSATSGQRGQLRIGTAGNQTAFIGAMVGGASVTLGTKNISIVPWAIAEEYASGIADTNMGNSLATYVSGQGFRALTFGTEYNTYTASAIATENIRETLTADLTGLTGKTINALVLNNNNTVAGTINFTGTGAGQTLALTAGTILFTTNTAAAASAAMGITISGFDAGITTAGASPEYSFFVQNPSSVATTPVVTATISSPLTTVADITKSGRGILVLSGTNIGVGGNTRKTTINEGTLRIADLDNIGGNTGGLVFAGGTLQLGPTFNVATDDVSTRTISFLNGGGTIDTNGLSPTFAGSLGSGSGTFTKIGAGNLTLGLTTGGTLTGGTVLSAGTLTLGAAQAIGTGALTVSGATTVLAMGSNTATVDSLTTNTAGVSITGASGVLTVNTSATLNAGSVAPVLAGTMNLIAPAAVTITLSNAANTFTGFTHIQQGTVSVLNLANVGSPSGLGAPAAGDNAAIRIGNAATGGTLLIAATGTGGTTNRPVWLAGTTGGGTIDNDGVAALTLNGEIRDAEYGAKTLTLQGATTGFGNVLNGIIDQRFGTVGLTKAEAGTWILANTAAPSTYTGFTTLTLGTLQVNRATGGLGDSTALNAINLNAGTLSLRNDGAGNNGSIIYGSASNPAGYNVQLTTTGSTINVANLTANTGNTIVLGPLTQATASARTLNVTGANGYSVTFASLGLDPSTGATTTLNPTTASLIITGNVNNPMTGFGTSNFDTIVLDGSSTGNSIGGVISDAVGGAFAPVLLGGYTKVTKSNISTWAISGANTYTGVTTVTGGTLLVNNTTGTGTGLSLVTVSGGTTAATQGVLGGTGIITGGVTLAIGTATTFAQGAALNPGTVGTAGTLTINTVGLTTNAAAFSKLNFDLTTAVTVGGGTNDLISTDVIPVIGATTQVNINALAPLTLGGLYTLANGYTGTLGTFGNLTLNPVFAGDATHTGVLQNNTNQLQLLVTNLTPSAAYWAGSTDANWNTLGAGAITNWRTDATTGTDTFALPGATTDVHFYTTNPVVTIFATTLAQNFTIKTLSFDAAAASATSVSGNTLTITPASSTTGITLDLGAGAVTINSNVALGAAQTWTNNATTLFTVTGSVTGAFGLTVAGTGDTTISGAIPAGITSLAKSGAGTLYLSNTNGFTGTTTISGGVVKIDTESGLGAAANDVTFGTGGGTWQVTAGFVANAGKVITVQAGPGTVQVDAGTLVIGSAIVGTLAATANGGGLIKSGPGTLALTVSSSSYDAEGVGTGGAAGLAGFRVDGGTLSLRGTSTSVVGDINPLSMAVQLNGGNLEILTDTASIARANIWVSASPATITVDRATPGNGITQNIGTGTGNGLTMGTGSSVLNIAGGANITGTTEPVTFLGTALFQVSPTFNVTNATGGGLVTLTLGALNDNAVARTISKNGNGTMILATAATSLVDGTVIDINGGTLNSNLAAAIGTLAVVDVGDGSTFGVGATQQIGALSNVGTILNNGIVSIGAFTLTVGNATNNLSSTFTGAITGATGILTKAGSGTLTLSGLSSTAASNYGGLTTISAGTLVLNTGNVSLTGGLTLGAAATTVPVALDIDGINATFGGALIMNINSATASTITVDATKTLTVNNNVQIGATTPAVTPTFTSLQITGGGIFNVTTAAAGTFTVGGSTSTSLAQDTTLDLTGLAATTINTSTTGTFRVNPSGATNLTGARATLLLPTPAVSDATVVTTITAGTFSVGNASLFNSNAGQVNSAVFGTGLTTLNADTVNIGTGGRDIGVLTFANANGDIIIRAADGASRSVLNIGTGGAGTGTTNPASNTLVDFSGHDANLLLTSLNVGNQARLGNLISEFKFGAGNGSIASTLDATSVNIGFRTGTATTTSVLTDNVNISGGTVTFGNVGATGTGVDIGNSAYTGAGIASTIGTLNISGGNVTIYNSTTLGAAIRLGTNAATGGGLVTASLNLTGGTITVGGHIIRNATSPGTTSTMLLDGASTLLNMGGFNIGDATNIITFDPRAGTLRNLGGLDGGVGTFTKTTSGTLTLDGTTVYTNPTDIQGGTIIADGTVNNRMGTGSLNLGNGAASAVLQLGGVSGPSNQTVASLATAGTGTTNAIVGGNASYSTLTVNQSTTTQFEGNIGGTGTNQNNLNVVKSGAGILVVSGTGTGAWTGTTTVSGGKLYIENTSAFAANTVSLTVGDGGEFAARGTGLVANDVHGFGASAGNKITVGSGAGTAILGFRVDGTYNTQLRLLTGQTMTVTAGSIFQTAVYVDDAPTAGQGYILIDGADNLSLHAGGGTFDFNPVVFNGGSFTYALSNVTLGGTVDRWVLTPTAQPALGDVWWRGDLTGLAQGVWSATLTSGTGFPSNWDDVQTSATAVDAQVPPDSGSIVHFSSDAGANFATTLGANLTIQELIFHSGASAISVDGNSGLFTLTLGNGTDPSGITLLSGAQSVIFTADVAIAQAQSFNVSGTGGGTLTFSRGISGTGPLSFNSNGSSTGTIILSTANGLATYTGATNLVAGRLILEGGASNRLPVGTALTMGNATLGAILQLGDATNGASSTSIGTLSSGAATTNSIVGGNPTVSTLSVNQTATGTFNGIIGGAGTNENSLALVKSGPALLTLSGANTYAGNTTITNGTLKLGAAGSIVSPLIITASAGVTATFDNNSRPIVLTGGITLGGLDTAATPVVANTGGTGSITLGGNVTYDGTNNPLGGSIAAPLNLGAATRTITANNSATAATDLTISAAVSSTPGAVGANGVGLVLDGAGSSALITGAISLANGTTDGGSADLTKNGTGTWTIQNSVLVGDDYLINAGTLTISGSGSLGWNATGTSSPDFVTTAATTITNLDVANAIVGNAGTNRLFARNGSTINLDVSGAIGTSIEQIILGDDNNGIGNLVLGAGTTNSVGRLDVGFNSAGETGNVTGTGTLTVTTNINLNSGTVSGNLAGAGAILKNQPLLVTVSGNNSLTGTTTVQQGTLTLDYATTPGTSNKIGTGNFTIGSPTQSELTAVMNLAGHATAASRQNVANFSVAGGPSQISLTGTTGVDNILRITGTLARTAGTVNFTLANANTKLEYSGATTNTNGALPAWMILNRSNFAAISENGAVDDIVAATYTTQNNPALWTTNQNITNSAGFSGTLDPECNTINTLRFNAAAPSTVTVGAGNVLIVSSGGIMATSAVGANASTITGGNLFSGVGELFFHQENTASTLTVASTILGGAAITKTGPGTLVLSGTNNSTGNVSIEEGIIRFSGGSALSDTSDISIFNNGGTANTGIELAASQTETVGNLIANTTAAAVILNTGSTLTVNQNSAQTMAGVISGAGTFVKSGSAILTLTGTSSLTGTLRIDGGQILLSGANSQLAAITALILNGPNSSIQNNQDQTASVNRINTATVLLNNTAGGTGFAISKNASTTSGTDAVGALTLGAGHNVITATSAIAATVGQWTFASLAARNNRATALVRGLALGDSVATQRGQIVFTAAPTGGNVAVGGGGAAASQNISIFPWLVGDATAAGLGNSFVMNTGATNGLRPLTAAEYTTDAAGFNALPAATLSNNNLRFTTGATLTGTATGVNSLVIEAATAQTVTGPVNTFEITSGAILAASSGTTITHTLGGFTAITTGGARDYTIYVTSATGTLTISSPLTSTVPLVMSGAGTLSLTAAGTGNQFSDIYLNQGRVLADDLDRLGTGTLRFYGGSLKLAAAWTDDPSTKLWDINTGGGVLDVSLVTAGVTLANGIDDTTVSAADTLNIVTRSVTTGTTGLLTIQGASTYTGTTIINQSVDSATVSSVVLNGTTNAAINGNLQIGNVTSGTPDVVVALGADEQIVNTATLSFVSASGAEAYFKLFGHTETVAGISAVSRGVIENHESATDTVAGNGTLIVNSSQDFSYTGFLRDRASGTGGTLAFTKQGTGTQTLIGANIIYTGPTTISGGTLQLTDATAFAAGSAITVTSPGNLTINRTTGTLTFANIISGTGSVTKLGAGTVTLSGATSSYSGVTNIQQGILSISASANIGDGSATNDIVLANLATLQSTGASVDLGTNRGISLAGTGGTIAVTGSNLLTFGGVISGDDCSPLFKSDTGTLILTGTSTYAAATNISAGTLQIGNGGTTGLLSSLSAIVNSGTLAFNRSNTWTFANSISGTGALNQIGTSTGRTVLTGTNTYTGITTVTSGTLQFGNLLSLYNNTPAQWTATNLVVQSGATAAFNVGGAGEFASSDIDVVKLIGTASGGFRNGSVIGFDTTNAGGSFAYGTAIGDTNGGANIVGLTKLGTGILLLNGSAANTYRGLTTVSAGILDLGKPAGTNAIAGDALPLSKSVDDVLINGGTLRLQANNQIGDGVRVHLTSGAFSVNGKTETIFDLEVNGGTFTTGAGAVFTVTDPTWTGGTNTISADSTANFGVLNLTGGTNTVEGAGAGTVGGVLNIGSTGLNFSGAGSPNLTINSDATSQGKVVLSGNVTATHTGGTSSITSGGAGALKGTLDLNGGTRTFTITDSASTLSVSAVIVGAAGSGLTKTGSGKMVVSSDSTFTGTTTVTGATAITGGVLEVTGKLSGTTAVVVNNSGTLLLNNTTGGPAGVNDIIGGGAANLTVGTGGTAATVKMADALSGNTQTFANLTLSGNSTLDFGTGNTNTFSFTGTNNLAAYLSGGTLTIRGWSGNFYDLSETSDHGPASQDRLLFSSDPGFGSNTVIDGISFFDDAGTFIGPGLQISFNGGFEIVPVPEPATTALIGAVALCALIGYRERRRFTRVCSRLVRK